MFIVGTNPKIIQRLLVHPTIGVELNAYSQHLPGVSEEATKNINEILRSVSYSLFSAYRYKLIVYNGRSGYKKMN